MGVCLPSSLRCTIYLKQIRRERKDGRLGRDVPRTVVDQGVPYPIPLRIPGARIVNLVAGGMWVYDNPSSHTLTD